MSKIFELIIEVIAWLQIVFSPLFIGFVIGLIVYLANPNEVTFTLGILITILGLVIGIIYASKIWKTKGTNSFLSNIMATPELDNLDKKTENKEEIKK